MTIENTGDMSDTNVQFTDDLDPNTTPVGAVTVTPIGANDNYSISGNTTLGSMFIDASNGLLANDADPDGGSETIPAAPQRGPLRCTNGTTLGYRSPA